MISKWLRSAWSGTSRFIEALSWADDYDPVAEQQRWIASLEKRIKRIETQLPVKPETPSHEQTRT